MEIENKPSSHIKYGSRIRVTIVRESEPSPPTPPTLPPISPCPRSSPAGQLLPGHCRLPTDPIQTQRPLLQARTVFPSPPCFPLQMLSKSLWLGWMDGRAGGWLASWMDCPFQFGKDTTPEKQTWVFLGFSVASRIAPFQKELPQLPRVIWADLISNSSVPNTNWFSSLSHYIPTQEKLILMVDV